jgi:hypothetical protein
MMQLELMQKRAKIGKFHCYYYLPKIGCGRYHTTSNMLAVRCQREQQAIEWGDVSLHHNYSKRMALSFNKEIQSRYYQDTSLSVKGALLEWIDVSGKRHARYFGHWLDD